MLNGDAATYRVHDMVRSAEGHRAGRSIAERRAARRATSLRRIAGSTRRVALDPVPALSLAGPR